MKNRKLFLFVAVISVFSMLLAACQSAATPAAIEPTKAPEATKAPAFTALKQEATDCKYGGIIKSIEAPDAKTVKFTLCVPDAAFPAKAAFASNQIMQKAQLDATGGDSSKISAKPVGTGPYILKEWVRGDHMTLEANPNYWGGAPTLKTLTIKWAKEPAQKLLELQSGNTDAIDAVGPDDIESVKTNTNLSFKPVVATNTLYFAMNNTVKPFDNEKIRQAFAQAIDKQRIVDNYFPVGSSIAEQFVYSGLTPGYTKDFKWYKYDKDAAKKALTDAGFDFNQEILFSYRQAVRGYNPQPDKIAADVQAQLAEIGVKIKLDVQESGTLLANSAAGKLGFFLLGWGEDYPDATDWYDYHFGPAGKSFGTPYTDIVENMAKAAQSADNAVRQKYYDEVNKLILQHVPMIPVAHGAGGQAYKATVKNVIVGPYNINFSQMTTDSGALIYTQSAEPIQLWCGDETDGETIRACMQIYEPLMAYKFGGTETIPGLATGYKANTELTEYTFTLRDGVKWSDGTAFTSADVFATYTAMWDYKNPNHKGNTGTFEYWGGLFSAVLNAPAK